MGIALESTRFAEKELAHGDLIEIGPPVFKHIDRETHFFSQRINERHVEKIKHFQKWLPDQVQLSASDSIKSAARVRVAS